MPDEPWTPRRALGAGSSISPSQFAHFVVRTPDLDGSATWYQAVLSARIVFRNNLLCFMTYDDEHHRIAFLHVDPEDSEVGTGAIDHVAYSFSDLGALLANYMRLKAIGIEPVRTINHGPTISFYYRDPQKIMLEFQVDNFDTDEGRNAFFYSDAFAKNPIGVIVSPDELIRQWESGVPWETIRARPSLPSGKTPMDMREERQFDR
jgi:catechol 2,3-dioxygenase-like lactoylglutathione lyase family enzyme